MPIFGLNNGMVPIIAYNYGARKPERLTKTIKLSIAAAVLIMVIGFVLFQTITEQLLMIFNASDNMLEIGVPALRIISICFLLAGFSIISSSLFQALSHGLLSLFVSLLETAAHPAAGSLPAVPQRKTEPDLVGLPSGGVIRRFLMRVISTLYLQERNQADVRNGLVKSFTRHSIKTGLSH